MTQGIAKHLSFSAPRRVAALLLAICLNLALVPCAMALQVVEEEHDCCPPELKLEALECCQIDDISVDARAGSVKVDDSDDSDQGLLSPRFPGIVTRTTAYYRATAGPPDPPNQLVPLHKLNCVYLK
jgi:hypothetical protein